MSDAVVHISGGGAQPQCPEGSSEDAKRLMEEFRQAFSHLHREGDSICSWLSEAQQSALHAYRDHHGLQALKAWDYSQLHEATQQETQLMEQFRARLESEGALQTEEDRAFCTAFILLKYLRARDHKLDKSYKMFQDTLMWRREHKPWQLENVRSRTEKMSSDARVVGYDLQGRVVVYSSFANTKHRTPADVQVNSVAMMEKAERCAHAGTPGNVIWVNHFGGRHKNGFNMWDCNPKFVWAGISVFSNHYPESLRTMIIVDPPAIFFNLWKTVKPLLPEKTQQKGEFVDSRQDNRPLFVKLFGEELADYLLHLIKQDA